MLIPLKNIKDIFDAHDNDSLLELFKNHEAYINKEIAKHQYALQLIQNIMDKRQKKSVYHTAPPCYESYFLDRTLYYHELNVPLEEIDKYVNRSDLNMIHYKNTENDAMCLLFSLSDYIQRKHLYVKGFGIFSDIPINTMKSKRISEGRFLNQEFYYSEVNCHLMLENILNNQKNDVELNDTFLLIAKTVDFDATSKYDYLMTLQFKYNLFI